ncbi:hypothetical protein HRW16_08625 [Streptomyces lunaelactis]|nr:hypothetical protein [Streptomyces lunaelactis]NUK36704.1 hypothetical protein [Streptomyces lunaelactis]NUK43159.1 hypothetical protein [Streptomyces lunaelactis]NUK91924.1 hypothetical protein [Streptomyces lunaelactis]NUL28476.1 hypothetical protein [Streptomyces lunaelactis]
MVKMRARLIGLLVLVVACLTTSLTAGSAPSTAAPLAGPLWFDAQAAA